MTLWALGIYFSFQWIMFNLNPLENAVFSPTVFCSFVSICTGLLSRTAAGAAPGAHFHFLSKFGCFGLEALAQLIRCRLQFVGHTPLLISHYKIFL